MSQARLASCISLPIEQKTLVSVIEKAKDWALMHGVGMRDRKQFSKDHIQIAPFVLLPSPFPRAEFNKAVELQPILNELMHKVAHDEEFLQDTLANALQVDEFTANLYDIWVKVRDEGITQVAHDEFLQFTANLYDIWVKVRDEGITQEAHDEFLQDTANLYDIWVKVRDEGITQVAHDEEFPQDTANLYDIWVKVRDEGITQVAHDEQFLQDTANLYYIWVKVRDEGVTQPVSLGMLRSDVMLESRCPHAAQPQGSKQPQPSASAPHTPYCSWKQVEINSIASGFGHLGPVSREIQRYTLDNMQP
ncbi:eukaryotic glutathione synthase, ATP binding domain-containing protein [Phthorimaea operculella]|nr:eukaryotic glutathione synthase, ATP binding domain-containing protein [Phthorimaea operculella]